jgi:cation transport ATPase
MSDFRDSRGREIAGPAHFFASLIEDEIVKGQQKKAQRQQAADRREARRMAKRPLSPAGKTLRRALLGAGLLTLCLWLSRVMLVLLRSPDPAIWLPLAVWGFAVLAGAFALRVGLKEAPERVPQNPMGAFWAAWVLVGIAVLWVKIVPLDAAAAYLVRGLYATGFAVVAVYFWIASGLAAGSAKRRIRRLANARNAPLRAARRSRVPFNWFNW